ncbi:Acetyltransferase, GNAT family [Candidatus Rhodobacter oscarellae]|uniref:Acetyltransferase, GNAT family n=1 Tax=Candidatus Rhodobacter oscarellae TaxID=1675527 RepID=A0A0J9EFR6_9RHOB|nr:GNAT family N-acetyltransferase [Candidatus Rhodobacter lobularis]KMW60524.1 Acetyltransferase, GNAT family [Candidatus Rhodobacter lobularis]
MTAPTLQTERLTLRAHRMEDFDAFAALWASEDSKFMGGPEDRNMAWHLFAGEIASWQLQGFGYWTLERQSDAALLGGCGFGRPPAFPERELGWYLYADHRGHGYVTEAARAARDFAYGTLGWSTLVSYISLQNAASIAVAERLGAVPDATAAYADGDTPEDTVVYRHPAPEALQ